MGRAQAPSLAGELDATRPTKDPHAAAGGPGCQWRAKTVGRREDPAQPAKLYKETVQFFFFN